MIKYGGDLIYETRDEYGPIEVIEIKQKLRSLHFGNATQQAAMFLYNPVVLIHKYTQAMLTSLCWRVPEKVLMLGVGGGSLAKYLLHFCSSTVIDAIELRPEVSRVAREYFSLYEHDRFHLWHGPAEELISDAAQGRHYDLVLVDLFLTTGAQDVSVYIHEHFELLKNVLSQDGVLSINVIGADIENYPGLQELKRVFSGVVYSMAVETTNVVLLACKAKPPENLDVDIISALEKHYGLPFRQYYDKLVQV